MVLPVPLTWTDIITLIKSTLEVIVLIFENGWKLLKWIIKPIQTSSSRDQEAPNSRTPVVSPVDSFDFTYGLDDSARDEYRYAANVPPNPLRLTLDYNSEITSEGQLKLAVLAEADSNVVEVFADGMGGIGKTCALRGLATDPDVRDRFADGILFIKLGNYATKATLMRGIRIIVHRTGGIKRANDLRTKKSLRVVVERATEWFQSRSCLFLVDDVWRTNGISNSDLKALSRISKGRSRMVYTTRDRELAIEGQMKITFHPRNHETSRMMLMNRSFDGDCHLSQENEEALRTILRVCAGHPLALSVAGGVVRKIAHHHSGNPHNALQYVSEKLSAEGLPETEVDGFGQVSRVVDASLTSLRLEGSQSCDMLFAKLCLLQKKDEPPIAILHRMWGMKDSSASDRLAKSFDNYSIIELRYHDGNRVTFAVHDLIVDIAKDRAGSQLKQFARQLLDDYMPRNWFGHREWWRCKDDKYIHDNLCRLLAAGDCKTELLWLLSKPQWIILRLQQGGASAVENDIRQGMRFISSEDVSTGSHVRHLQVVQEAALMAHPYVSSNKYEAWFQMQGRLLSYAQACKRTERFVQEIEMNAPRPWAKASLGILDAAGGALRHVLRIDEDVLHVALRENNAQYFTKSAVSTINILNGDIDTKNLKNIINDGACFAMSSDGKRVVTGYDDGTVRVWDVDNGQVVNALPHDYTGRVKCVDISSDGKRVVSLSKDGKMRVWVVDSGVGFIRPLQTGPDRIEHVAISGDGKRVVLGSFDRIVQVWVVDSGEVVKAPSHGNTDRVRCIAISDDGKRVVSERSNRILWVWNVDSGGVANAPLTRDTGYVSCIAISGDGKRFVSVLNDVTVIVMEVDTKVVDIPLHGNKDSVSCVAISGDGKRVISGSRDRTVRVWDVDSREVAKTPLHGHDDWVKCAAISADGKRVVSGSQDWTVRVWDADSGEAVNAPLRGHTGLIRCVAISGDGKRAVSGSFDCTLRVWDIDNGVIVGTPLLHLEEVTEVAIDENGEFVLSKGPRTGIQRLWDVSSGRCICTSEESRWLPEVEQLSLTWSSMFPLTHVLKWPSHDGQLILATLQSKGFRLGRAMFNRHFSGHCKVVDC